MIRKDKNKVKMSDSAQGGGEEVDVIDTFEDLTVEPVEEVVEPEVAAEPPAAPKATGGEDEMPSVDGDLIIDEGDVFDMNIPPSSPPKNTATPSANSGGSENPENLPATASQVPARMSPDQQERFQKTGTELKTYATDITQAGAGGEAEEGGSVRKKGRIGDRLVDMGLITNDQLNVALQEKKISNKMLGEVMVDLGFIDEETLSAFLAESSGFELFDPQNTIFDGDALALIEKDQAVKHQLLPVSIKGDELKVAMADPYDIVAMDALRRHLPKGMSISPMVCTAKTLSEAIDAAYGYASSVKGILEELEEGKEQKDVASLSEDEAFSHPIVRLVNALVFEAVKTSVSDLHFEPEENFIRLRYRKDGVLYTAQILHKQHWPGISQRIKIMSGMNIADKLMPQDGRFGLNIGGREADFRVSSLPTVHGENIVLRVLDQSESIMPMEKLGFSEHNLGLIKQSQSKPEGIIIVTGPTGSGKTTSLYSMLNEINDVQVNIQTLEDPVEYSLPMIRQTHVREGVLEFADGIKALLRQDPDIIFIGEIRDGETAGMALKAAMTGHQVYTTLHTNDSFGAIPRLFDLGLKPGMVSGAIIAIFAQRLTRRLCGCREEYTATTEDCETLGVDPNEPPQIFKAREGGCEVCGGSGYKGRTAVVEILTFDEELDELLASGANKAELRALAVKKGFKSMKDDGILKVLEGVTSLDALAKVVDIRR